ncbi:hypothetical protein [Spirosoma fluminis]
MAFLLNVTTFCLTLSGLFFAHAFLQSETLIRHRMRIKAGFLLLLVAVTAALLNRLMGR